VTVRVYAPASVGNFGVGFDVLGAAVAPIDGSLWGDIVEVDIGPGEGLTLDLTGPYAHELPSDPSDNVVSASWMLFRQRVPSADRTAAHCHVRLHKGLPTSSGLGSSASSIVAALVAFNAAYGEPASQAELLAMAGQLEVGGALDNVAPCLLGGLRLIGMREPVWAEPVPFPSSWLLAVVHPAVQVSTRLARQILPSSVPLVSAVEYWKNLASLVHALHAGDEELARACLHDGLIEPHRAALVPFFDAVRAAAVEAGAFGVNLSGSGPSIFAVTDEPRAASVLEAMADALRSRGIPLDARICRLDMTGSRLLPP